MLPIKRSAQKITPAQPPKLIFTSSKVVDITLPVEETKIEVTPPVEETKIEVTPPVAETKIEVTPI